MQVIRAHNVNDAYRKGLRLLIADGLRSESRNGPVVRLAEPVSTVYALPCERVLLDRKRHAHPFFHLFEALWMLNGQNDVKTMDGFLKTFKRFSDDGVTFHGAYGHRWRHWPWRNDIGDFDQIAVAIDMLKRDPTNRRVVIGMWNPAIDLDAESKDIPCNDMIKLWIPNDGRLNMVVFNRSNDVVWGCYGANAVHMSVLHEYISAMIGRPQGTMTQISCDFHAYLETPYDLDQFVPNDLNSRESRWTNPYEDGTVAPYHLVSNPTLFDEELKALMAVITDSQSVEKLNPNDFTNHFFSDVAIPMHRAWEHIRKGDRRYALTYLARESKKFFAVQNDWIMAGMLWIEETWRRQEEQHRVGELKEA